MGHGYDVNTGEEGENSNKKIVVVGISQNMTTHACHEIAPQLGFPFAKLIEFSPHLRDRFTSPLIRKARRKLTSTY